MNRFLVILFLIPAFFTFSQEALETIIQKGHTEVVKSMAITDDGKFLLTGSRDKSVKLWDIKTGFEMRSFLGHQSSVNDISINGNLMATSSADNTAKLWDINTGKLLWTSPRSVRYRTAVAISPNGKWLAVGGYDDLLSVYDIATKDSIATIKVNSDQGNGYGVSIRFTKDNKYMVIGEDNHGFQVVSTSDWKVTSSDKLRRGSCGGCGSLVEVIEDKIAKLSNSGTLTMFNPITGKTTDTLVKKVKDVVALSYHHNHLLYANDDSVWVISLVTKQQVLGFKPIAKEVHDAKIRSDVIYVGGSDNVVEVYTLKGKLKYKFEGTNNVELAENKRYEATSYWNRNIIRLLKYKKSQILTTDNKVISGRLGEKTKMWDLKTAKGVMEFHHHDLPISTISLTTDEKILFSADQSGLIVSSDIESGKVIKRYKGHREPIFDIKINKDQTKMISASWDATVLVWDIKSGDIIKRISLDNNSCYSVSFSENELYIIIGQLDGSLSFYELNTGKKVKEYIGHSGRITSITTIGSDTLLSTGANGILNEWNKNSALITNQFKHQEGGIYTFAHYNNFYITGGTDRDIYIWNKNGGLYKKLTRHKADVVSLQVSTDKTKLISLDLDGVTKCWNLKDFSLLFDHIQMSEREYITKTPEGYYYATDGALNKVHYVKGMKCYSPDQFFDEFYKTDVLQSVRGSSIDGYLNRSLPPEVKLVGIPSKDKLSATLHLKLIEHESPIKEVLLFHNGKRLALEIKDLTFVQKDKEEKYYTYKAPLISGHNQFTLKALNKEKVSSLPVTIDVSVENSQSGSNCYLLVIGIDDYKNSKLDLNFAQADASSFVSVMGNQEKGLYKEIIIDTLYNKNATKENILASLDKLQSEASINDVVMIYFAGHGSYQEDMFYFIPHDAVRLMDANHLKEKGISSNEVQEKLRNTKALKQFIIIDACQSGGSLKSFSERGAKDEKAIAQLSRSSGIHVLASAGADQYASEFQELGHGIFTYVLLQALEGKADGSPNDGSITVYEVKSYIDNLVPEMSIQYKGKPQYPNTFSQGQDFPLLLRK